MLLAAGADPVDCCRAGETLLMQVLSLTDVASRYQDRAGDTLYTDGASSTMIGYILNAIVSSPLAADRQE
jgi:hypothetical protein